MDISFGLSFGSPLGGSSIETFESTLTVGNGWHDYNLSRDASGVHILTIDGVEYINETFATDIVLNSNLLKIGALYSLNASYYLGGQLIDFDFKVIGSSVATYSGLETDSWTDISDSSNDGTVNGTPVSIYIPALVDNTADAANGTILNPAIAGGLVENGSETSIVTTRENTQYNFENINATEAIKLNGNDINTSGTLSNVVYLDDAAFAEIYVSDGSTAQSIPIGATYTKITGYTNNGLSSNCTADVANDKITFTKTGIYRVNGCFTAKSGNSNITFNCAAFLNDVKQDQIQCSKKYVVSIGENTTSGFTGYIDVTTVGWDLDVRIKHNSGITVNWTPVYMNLNVSYLGET